MMKNHKFFGAIACSVIALTISSCGKEDKIERFPEGTSMIKMMDEDNGGTTLSNSNVYMTSSGNFKSNDLPILDCGKKSGIGDIGLPDFTNMAPEVAVIPGHGFPNYLMHFYLRQIEEKGYARLFISDHRKIFKIGVNFSTSTRRIDGWKVTK